MEVEFNRFGQPGSRTTSSFRRKLFWRGGAEAILLLLFALTVFALYAEEALLTRTVNINPAASQAAAHFSYADDAVDGRSSAMADTRQAIAGTCELRSGYAYPYCGFGMLLNVKKPEEGLDLSRSEKIVLDLTYHGTAQLLTFVVKNYDPQYSRPGAAETEKPNTVDFKVHQKRQTVTIAPGDLSVAEWWFATNDAAENSRQRQLDNVVALALQTGPHAALGRHSVQVHSITATVRVISRTHFHMALLVLWMLAITNLIVRRRREAEHVQRELAERREKFLDAIPQMVWAADGSGYEYYNRQWEVFTGVNLLASNDSRRLDLVHPDDQAHATERWNRSLKTGDAYEAEYRLLHRSGDFRWVLSRALPERSAEGGPACWYGTCTDIHDRVLATHAREESERLTKGIVAAIPDCVSLLDSDGRRIFVNQATQAAYAPAEEGDLLTENWLDRLPAEALAQGKAQLESARRGHVGRVTLGGQNGRWWDTLLAPVVDGDGQIARILVVSRDITEQKAIEERANWAANHDSLTKLPNRMLLQRRLERMTDGPDATENPFALVLLDVDNFKQINDTAGHDAGDALLCTFAERLQAAVRATDTVARLSGDEFALLLTNTGSEGELQSVLDRIVEELRKPCIYAGRVFDCSASVGAGIFGRHGASPAELLKNVDVALYAAKAAGKGTFRVFRSAHREEIQKRSSMLSLARDALTDGRICPNYQPKVDLRTGNIAGFEALLRWQHPEKGWQLPNSIAAAFEDLSLASEISERMINQVVADLVAWRAEGIEVGPVAVNASAAEFRRGDFAERLLEKMHKASLPVEALQLEITETVFLGRGAECVERALKTLSGAGMKIALDDFGTGYASLSHLNQFPVNILKIDRSFVHAVQGTTTTAPIIDAVINLGKSLDMAVVAEGVETQIQHDFLINAGCNQGQGFLYSRAVAAAEVSAMLQNNWRRQPLAA